jgi:hypothetical protein
MQHPVHGGCADPKALGHRAQGLPLQHHRFHHLSLAPFQLAQSGQHRFRLNLLACILDLTDRRIGPAVR